MDKAQYFRLESDDYALPGFVSFGKYYFGTMEDIRELINALNSDPETKEHYQYLIDAFVLFEKGHTDKTHRVAHREVPLLLPASVLFRAETSLVDYEWEHLNIWGWPYNMRCDKVDTEHLWLCCENEFSRCIKARFQNLQYMLIDDKWKPIGDMLWGFPHMLKVNRPQIRNRLAIQERNFVSMEESIKDWSAFQNFPQPNFTGICNEIFGDG